MDKVRPLEQVWIAAIGLCIVGAALARWRWWLALVSLPMSLALIGEVADPKIRPLIYQESGSGYAIQVYEAFLLCVVVHLAALYRARTRHNFK